MRVFDVVWLKQGWTENQRQKYYQTSQGTLILPYSWFVALEVMPTSLFVAREGPATSRWWRLSIDNQESMSSHENLSRYRLIPDVRPQFNPDLLPIGITKEVIPDEYVDQLGAGHKEWISYSCAACHTAQLSYRGLGIRIDGAPSLWNFTQFNTALANALLATDAIPSKFDRFATRVLEREGKPVNSANKTQLKNALRAFLESPPIKNGVEAIFKRTYPIKEGFGEWTRSAGAPTGSSANSTRTTSFSPIRRSVFRRSGTRMTSTGFSPSPPSVSRWGEMSPSRGRQRSGGSHELRSAKRYASTHPMKDLFWMETLISVLNPPDWPQNIFGPVDNEAAKRGKQLYEERIFAEARLPRRRNCGRMRTDRGRVSVRVAMLRSRRSNQTNSAKPTGSCRCTSSTSSGPIPATHRASNLAKS